MIRQIKVRNITLEPIEIGEITIPAMGTVTMSYKKYLALAVEHDLTQLDVRVIFPDVEVKRVSVKDFGAKGDGITNDTQAIQSAVDYVASYGGGVVDVPIGVYLIDGILVGENITLQGESKNDSVLKLRSGVRNSLISFANAIGGMSKLRLVGNGM